MTWQKNSWTTWVDDTQVVYRIERLAHSNQWIVHKRVAGAANRTGLVIGTTDDPRRAWAIAEADAREPM